MWTDFADRRITVMGLGRFGGGVGVARWLARQGGRVTVTDLEPAERMGASTAALAGLGITFRLGAHDERDFRAADLVVANPAVKPDSAYLQAAAAAGVPVTTEINLFLERCRGRCVGVTGTVGKSTTTAMAGHILEQTLVGRKTWVGGNIGVSLLDVVTAIRDEDAVVLELSSFQLERTPLIRWSPEIAVITNLAPNHLDWHGSFAAYLQAKLNLARFQTPQRGTLIHDAAPDLAAAIDTAALPAGRRWTFGVADAEPALWPASAGPAAGPLIRWSARDLRVPGRHNRLNAAAALAVGHALGVDDSAAAAALAGFPGLPHRLQFVAERRGVRYYNDSKATTPEALDTALQSFDEPLLLILGGYDKGADLRPVMQRAATRAKLAACLGVTGPRIAETIRSAGGRAEVVENLAAAVAACGREARAGDVVLLSPACASWGMYTDYRARGDEFTRLVLALA